MTSPKLYGSIREEKSGKTFLLTDLPETENMDYDSIKIGARNSEKIIPPTK